MSFFSSLNQLWTKIQQKNIVLVSGNVDEIIPTKLPNYKDIINESQNKDTFSFISLTEFLSRKSKSIDNLNFFSNFSSIMGNEITNNSDNEIYDRKTNDKDDEFSEFEEDSNKISVEDYISWINDQIISMRSRNNLSSCIFVINFSDILFNDRLSNVPMLKLSQLIESFLEYRKMMPNMFIENNYKLVIICRNPNVLNSLITNNVEFGSVVLSKPDKLERENFFKCYGYKFTNLKETINDETHQDFKDAISISDGLSFREMLQLSKLQNDEIINKKLSFSELYKLATFFKKESEWEKIDTKKIQDIEKILSKRVKGQEMAIQKVKQTLIRSFVGLNGILHSVDNNKPKGVLFFTGPTGTGKTELAKSISEFVFNDENRIIRFDMSEFNHEHSDQRLIGAPPGYVGYDNGGELTNKVKQNPFSILLFDEIEKAHGRILDKFLQILEDGRLTSSQGEIIDFSQTFIIFTSNIGARNALKNLNNKELENYFIKEVKKYFKDELNRPELLNRIGEKNIVSFNFINDPNIIKEIINSKLNKISNNLIKNKNIELIYNEEFIQDLTEEIYKRFNSEYGGRGIITELETFLIDPLSIFLFSNFQVWNEKIKNNLIMQIRLSISNAKIHFEIKN